MSSLMTHCPIPYDDIIIGHEISLPKHVLGKFILKAELTGFPLSQGKATCPFLFRASINLTGKSYMSE